MTGGRRRTGTRNAAPRAGRLAPELLQAEHGHEIRALYRRGVLRPEAVLTGRFEHEARAVDVGEVMRGIDDARAEEAARRLRMQRAVKVFL